VMFDTPPALHGGIREGVKGMLRRVGGPAALLEAPFAAGMAFHLRPARRRGWPCTRVSLSRSRTVVPRSPGWGRDADCVCRVWAARALRAIGHGGQPGPTWEFERDIVLDRATVFWSEDMRRRRRPASRGSDGGSSGSPHATSGQACLSSPPSITTIAVTAKLVAVLEEPGSERTRSGGSSGSLEAAPEPRRPRGRPVTNRPWSRRRDRGQQPRSERR
jgi:hypothetical protein